MRRRLLTILAAVAAFAVPVIVPSLASATFHLVSIREVFPGSASQPEAEYVELQAYAAGQEFIAGHSVSFRDKDGAVLKTETFSADVSDGRNQMTFVMATPLAETRFGISADDEMAPNLIDPAGGAICWESLDCVSWGSFGGGLPSPGGSPATPPGIPDEQALRRTIAPGCATLLELFDDRDNSALDFLPVFPAPRPNSIAPTEKACDIPGGGGSGSDGGEKAAPQTMLKRRPPQRTRDRTPTFRFSSNETNATFQCRIDRRPFRSCRSPFTVRRLSLGWHTFRVRAVGPSGSVDRSPARDAFKVIRRP